MKPQDVPQDDSSTYHGHKRLLYARSEEQGYKAVQSSGWDIEEQATLDAVHHFDALAEQAACDVAAGRRSPLYYHMYRTRMSPQLIAQSTGLFVWQVKRHFRPRVFAKLPERTLQRYADAMGMTLQALGQGKP